MMSAVGRRSGMAAVVCGLVVTPLLIVVDELRSAPADLSSGLSGVLPLAVVAAMIAIFVLVLRRFMAAPRDEIVQALVILLLVVLAVLTITGVWFRGEGMSLLWPWEIGG